MNYIGSKYKLLPFLEESIRYVTGDKLKHKVFCDLFAGTGVVGRYFKNKTQQVIANDWEYYSYILNRNYIGNAQLFEASEWISKLNRLPGVRGFIYQQFSEGGSAGRLYFSGQNGQKIDAVRAQIQKWYLAEEINDDLYFFLLASLIESADKVANTASVYGAFLKKIKPSAAKELMIREAAFEASTQQHRVYQEDSNELIKRIKGDILYLDPPYNSRHYGANYHLLNTIARYIPFHPKGKTGLDAYLKSDFCSATQVTDALRTLLEHADFQYIFLSYNNEGLIPESEIRKIMSSLGTYRLFRKDYQRFKADRTERRNHKADRVEEHLHVLTKS
ncbi:MAG: DNA adenine methylase [Taibaiella sp.]|nr:DNA adenine methylase [Taibaiella sp.]